MLWTYRERLKIKSVSSRASGRDLLWSHQPKGRVLQAEDTGMEM